MVITKNRGDPFSPVPSQTKCKDIPSLMDLDSEAGDRIHTPGSNGPLVMVEVPGPNLGLKLWCRTLLTDPVPDHGAVCPRLPYSWKDRELYGEFRIGHPRRLGVRIHPHVLFSTSSGYGCP